MDPMRSMRHPSGSPQSRQLNNPSTASLGSTGAAGREDNLVVLSTRYKQVVGQRMMRAGAGEAGEWWVWSVEVRLHSSSVHSTAAGDSWKEPLTGSSGDGVGGKSRQVPRQAEEPGTR